MIIKIGLLLLLPILQLNSTSFQKMGTLGITKGGIE